MTDEQLYIDGQLVDINDGTNITLSIASNLFRDIAKMISNKTYTFRLPRTTKNARILQFVDNVSSASTFPYEYHKARYIRSGVELIADGQATILSASATDIEMCVAWGLYPAFSSLVNSDVTLNKLSDPTATITWNYPQSPDKYADIANRDYFYAALDFLYTELPSTWWNNMYDVAPNTTSTPDKSKLDYLPQNTMRPASSILNPSVRVSYILNLIRTLRNVDFHWSGDALATINNLIVPLITRKPSEASYPINFQVYVGHFAHAAESYTLTCQMQIRVSSPYLTPVSGTTTSFVVNTDIRVMFRMACRVLWDFDNLTPNRDGTYTFVGGFFALKIKHEDNTEDVYYNGENYFTRAKTIDASELDTLNDLYEYYYAKGVVELHTGDVITLQFSTDVRSPWGDRPIQGQRPPLFEGEANLDFSLVTDAELVQDGQQYPITDNLPEIKIVDFVRCLAAVTGTFPKQPKQGTTEQVTFVPIDALWNNMPNAKDWSGKLVAQRGENVPKKIEYNLAEWAQNNRYKWKECDDVAEGYGDGNLTIPNETLDVERDVINFPFAATEGNSIASYEAENNVINVRNTEPRLLTLFENENADAAGMFDLAMNDILGTKYAHLAATLRDINIITETFVLSDFELLNFDETIPVYLKQYGAYFAVLEIKSSKAGIAEVQMLKLN
jgi:hypothetical protein